MSVPENLEQLVNTNAINNTTVMIVVIFFIYHTPLLYACGEVCMEVRFHHYRIIIPAGISVFEIC